MKVLAMDTSAIVASVAVIDDKKLVIEMNLNHKKTHSQKIMPMVEEALECAELKPKDIDIFAAAIGPGSFTGLRIGVSTVKALAHALGKKVAGVNTLDALAFNVPYFNGFVCPIMDARRSQVYTAVYEWNQDHYDRKSDYMAVPIGDLIDIVLKYDKEILFLGDGVPVYKEEIQDKMGTKAVFAPSTCCFQRASSVASLALKKVENGEISDFMKLEPFYLRKSQAEREFDKLKK